jgi:hypothetical protein
MIAFEEARRIEVQTERIATGNRLFLPRSK